MKHYFRLICLSIALSTIVLTPGLRAYNHTLIETPDIFLPSESNFKYLKITITAGQARSSIPSPMAREDSDLRTVLLNHKFVSAPNLRTGTVQDFECYFIAAGLTEAQILDWHAAYMNDSFIAIAKRLPNYDQKLKQLQRECNNQNKFSEWFCSTFGSQPKNFKEHINELYHLRVRERKIEQAARIQVTQLAKYKQIQQKTQAFVRKAWPENFELLQGEIPEWQDLSEMFLEHKFGDNMRLPKRIAVLSQLNSNSNSVNNSGANSNGNFSTQNYNISPEINTALSDAGLNPIVFTNCYGNQFQQLIHQENLDQLQQLGTLSPLSPIFYHKVAITECVDSAREYNQGGLVHDSVKVTDMCWALLDYGRAICEGATQGIIMIAKDLVDHPEHALLLVIAGEYILAYQIAKVTYDVAKIGIAAWQDQARSQTEWDNYIAPVTGLVSAFENNEISARDALKAGTMLAVSCRAQGKLSNGLGKLCKVTKANALTYLKNNHHATPQLYMSTPDGKILKATNKAVKLTGSERRRLREQRAAAQITEFMTELSKENRNKAVRYATTDDKLDHFFKDKHKLNGLLLSRKGKKKKVVKDVIKACVGKLPVVGEFKDIPINISSSIVYVRGYVINGVPLLGTIFIK